MLISTSINKMAWSIRKAAAKKYSCPVLEISWKECYKLALVSNPSPVSLPKTIICKRCHKPVTGRVAEYCPSCKRVLDHEIKQQLLVKQKRKIFNKVERKAGRRVDHLKRNCIKEIERVVAYFSSKYKTEIPLPEINFKKKGKSAGHYSPRFNKISLHWGYLKQEREKYIKRTPGHEAVHYIEVFMFGKSSHGARWKKMMLEVGLDPKRTHKYDSCNFGVKKPYVYLCECMEHKLSQLQHERAQNRGTYWCQKCRTTLIFDRKEK